MKKLFKTLIKLSLFGLFIYILRSARAKKFDVEEKLEEKKEVKTRKKVKPNNEIKLSYRQRAVLNIIKTKKKIRMRELLMRVPGVSERTLRRDLGKLQEAKLIKKTGSTKSSCYIAI